jgi:hypothetical protein
MGNVAGSVWRYERDRLGMTPIEWEMVGKLLSAYPSPVPYSECVTLSNGDPGEGKRAATVASSLRLVLGRDAVTTVVRMGYKAGPALLALLEAHASSEEASEAVGPVDQGVQERAPHRRSWMRWTAPDPHRGRQETIMTQMEAACREAVGL